jgi:hypothetical protein
MNEGSLVKPNLAMGRKELIGFEDGFDEATGTEDPGTEEAGKLGDFELGTEDGTAEMTGFDDGFKTDEIGAEDPGTGLSNFELGAATEL